MTVDPGISTSQTSPDGNPRENDGMTTIDQIRDPVVQNRARLTIDRMRLIAKLADTEDPATIADIEARIEQTESTLADLNDED